MVLPRDVIVAMIRNLAAKYNLKAEPVGDITATDDCSFGPALPKGLYVFGLVTLSSPDTPTNPNGPRVVTAAEFFDNPFNNADARIRKYAIDMGAYTPPAE